MDYVTDDGVALVALGHEARLLADLANDVNENSLVLRLTYRCTARARMLAAGADLEALVVRVTDRYRSFRTRSSLESALHREARAHGHATNRGARRTLPIWELSGASKDRACPSAYAH